MNAPVSITVTLSPESIAELRTALLPTPAQLELLAELLAAKMSAPAALTVPAFAKKHGMHRSTVYALITDRKLRAVRPGGNGDQRITAEAELAWLSGL